MTDFARRIAGIGLSVLVLSALFSSPAHALICGDLLLDPGEICDDGNLVSGDGCDANCTPTGCGNGVVTASEVCDDGNLISGDGCDANCTPTACGNGVVTSGEACDDGNLVDGDGCDSNCTPTGCGNSIVTAPEACDTGPSGSTACDPDCTLPACGDGTVNPFSGEQCDDANLASGDGCDANCTLTTCGNGIVTAGEACDDGNLASGDGCDGNCTPTGCGNSILTAGEQCDDGNLVNGDGCDGNCTPTGCGNGTLTAGEQCDDGNLASGDGCDGNCTPTGCGNSILTAGEQCDDGNLVSGDGCDSNCTATGCGNGIVTSPEQCDDGNLVNNDGCDANCTAPACGNGILNPPEQCDDNNLINGDGCDSNCRSTGCGNGIMTPPEQCDDGNVASGDGCDANCTATACGNGITTAPEQCDDGNLVSGDGCDANCSVTTCGNGVVTGTEVCDDGNPNSGDGCDANCTPTGCGNSIVTGGEGCDDGNLVPGDGCRANCTVELCADGIVDPQEQCDDGNLVNGDGCDANCATTGCGNSILTGGEQCDDGNLLNGDGCSSTCQRELLNPVPAAGDHFGYALAAAGTNIIVGVPLHDQANAINAGLAYLYSGTTFQPIRIFQNPTPNAGDQFGYAVAGVGQNILVGAPFDNTAGPGAGAAYLFDGVTGSLIRTILNPEAHGNKQFGRALAALDSTKVLIGAPVDDAGLHGGGVVYLYNAATGSLAQVFLNPTPAGGDEFGSAIAVLGGHVLIGAPGYDIPGGGFNPGAPDAGAVHGFDVATGALVTTIENPAPRQGARFGYAVATLGSDLLASAPFSHAGAVYRVDTTSGAALNTYLPPQPVGDDTFGTAIVVVGGNKIAVGAIRGDATTLANTGVVHLFDADTETLLQTITKVAPGVGDEFGRAVATTGSYIVVGAPQDDTVEVDAGAVYFFPDNSCGNGVVDPLEQCDDGNLVSSDGCDSNCLLTACGNGVVTAPEQCDDGNNTAGDGCSPICGLEGACGDGVQTAFEQCDDGNLASGDGCDANCTFTACGNGFIAGPEQCDNGPANGTDLCCSATCQRIDADGDGICDRDDVCPNTPDPLQRNVDGDVFGDACDICPADVNNDNDNDLFCTGPLFNPPALGGEDPCSRTGDAGTWFKAKALFSHLGAPAGDDRMRLKGRFNVGSVLPIIAPHLNGVRVRVTDQQGHLIVDEKIPGGSPSTLRRWKVSGAAHNEWVYKDRTKPAVQNGISQIVIRNQVYLDPTLFSISVRGDKGTYPLVPGGEPVRVTLELNAAALPRGGTPGRDQCGEIQYLEVGKPACTFNGFKLNCK